jgi:hypothetical protein
MTGQGLQVVLPDNVLAADADLAHMAESLEDAHLPNNSTSGLL